MALISVPYALTGVPMQMHFVKQTVQLIPSQVFTHTIKGIQTIRQRHQTIAMQYSKRTTTHSPALQRTMKEANLTVLFFPFFPLFFPLESFVSFPLSCCKPRPFTMPIKGTKPELSLQVHGHSSSFLLARM